MAESSYKDPMDLLFDQAFDVVVGEVLDGVIRNGVSCHMIKTHSARWDKTTKTSPQPATLPRAFTFPIRSAPVGRGKAIVDLNPIVPTVASVAPTRLPSVGRGIAIKDWKQANIKPTIRKFVGSERVLSGRIAVRQSDMQSETHGKAVNPPSDSHTMTCDIVMVKPPKGVVILKGADCFDFISNGMAKRRAGFCWKTSFYHAIQIFQSRIFVSIDT